MPPITTAIFDIGHVLFQWDPRFLFEKLIDDPEELDWFLDNVVTKDWHFQADTGRPLALMLEERIAEFPDHEELIRAYAERWNETVPGPICGSHEIVRELSGRGVPLYAITNFGAEFWAGFRPTAPIFDRFRAIVVSGEATCKAEGEMDETGCRSCQSEVRSDAWSNVPNDVPCDDGDVCSTGDACETGFCIPGSPKDCSDGLVCTLDSCDAETGACSNEAIEGCAGSPPFECLGGGEPAAMGCDAVDSYEGCCDPWGRVLWCGQDENGADVTFCMDCAGAPYCGWNNSWYWCGAEEPGITDPSGLFPLQCPGLEYAP